MTDARTGPPGRSLPWRSPLWGWLVATAALVVGGPLFLCLPPWNDVTLHDMVVRTILRGGVPYRDVFDTNLPGIDWAMAAVRLLFGWGYEVLRAVDLLVIAAEVALLAGWVRRAGGSAAAVAWLAAAVALWYPFTSEFCHVQRDPWLLLPALAAARLRLRHVARPSGAGALAEGVVWGLAVWVKPHVLVPAAAVWAVSAVTLVRDHPLRVVTRDLAGLVVGGLLAGAGGLAWLVGTGAWPYFLDVFLNWNPAYLHGVTRHTWGRFEHSFVVFRPWGLVLAGAVPLALLALWEGRVGSWRPGPPARIPLPAWLYAPAGAESTATARAVLATLFLAWYAQAVTIQKGFDYTYVPVTLLAMALLATQSWAFGFVYAIGFAALGLILNLTSWIPPSGWDIPGVNLIRLEHQPFTRPEVLALWPRCCREGASFELWDRLGRMTGCHCATRWQELAAVAEFLRSVRPTIGPRELNCWHDSTHPLYLLLDLEPATRFMHYGTAFGIIGKREAIAAEVAASPQRYVVSNLARMTWDPDRADEPGAGGDPLRLPAWFPRSQRDKFPWNQPIRFRAGPYLVHEVVGPLGEIDIPDWGTLDRLGPGDEP